MKSLIALTLLLISAGIARAQQTREIVMYDPLFWKDKLSLKHAQSRKIDEINNEFYNGLRQLKSAPYTKSELRNQLDVSLQERSVKIWATLDNKQKRKLEKILEQTTFHGP